MKEAAQLGLLQVPFVRLKPLEHAIHCEVLVTHWRQLGTVEVQPEETHLPLTRVKPGQQFRHAEGELQFLQLERAALQREQCSQPSLKQPGRQSTQQACPPNISQVQQLMMENPQFWQTRGVAATLVCPNPHRERQTVPLLPRSYSGLQLKQVVGELQFWQFSTWQVSWQVSALKNGSKLRAYPGEHASQLEEEPQQSQFAMVQRTWQVLLVRQQPLLQTWQVELVLQRMQLGMERAQSGEQVPLVRVNRGWQLEQVTISLQVWQKSTLQMMEEQAPLVRPKPILQEVQVPATELLQTTQLASLQIEEQQTPASTMLKPGLQLRQVERVLQVAQFATMLFAQSITHNPSTARQPLMQRQQKLGPMQSMQNSVQTGLQDFWKGTAVQPVSQVVQVPVVELQILQPLMEQVVASQPQVLLTAQLGLHRQHLSAPFTVQQEEQFAMVQGVAVQLRESLARDFPEDSEHIEQTDSLHLMQSSPYRLQQLWQTPAEVLKYQSMQREEHSLWVRLAQRVQVDPEGTEIWMVQLVVLSG